MCDSTYEAYVYRTKDCPFTVFITRDNTTNKTPTHHRIALSHTHHSNSLFWERTKLYNKKEQQSIDRQEFLPSFFPRS
jgi:hypothetical protein